MRRQADLQVLRRLTEVRIAQRLASDRALSAAQTEVRDAQRRHDQSLSILNDLQTSWSRTMHGASIDLSIAGSWLDAVRGEEVELRRLRLSVEAADDRRRDAVGHWRGAVANALAADSLKREAAKSLDRAREEATLSELTDRFSRQGRPRP